MLSVKQIEDNRRRVIDLLLCTNRKGIDTVLEYLDTSGFYTAPSSRNRHHNWKGGLAQHSLGVFESALISARDLPLVSLIICGILHDICKARMLYYDSNGNIHHNHIHIQGHGYRSIKLLEQCKLELKESERLAIRWHMGIDQSQEAIQAHRDLRLCRVIHYADKRNATKNE